MKILYTTDLHGKSQYYSLIWKAAMQNKVDMVINGGDLLPKTNPVFRRQPKFIKFLDKSYFPKFEKAGIHYLCCMGNDDLKIFDQIFNDVCGKYQFVHHIAQMKLEINGFEFIGCNYVADYPFGLKDRCRMDTKDFVFPEQYGDACFSSNNGWANIDDWFSLAQSLPTLADELKALPAPKNMSKTIYVIHMPPADLNLDVCMNGDRPASMATLNFLLKQQPLLSLHGHIHESFLMTGIWKAHLGKTICVQPGQGGFKPVYVLIDTDTMEMKRFE